MKRKLIPDYIEEEIRNLVKKKAKYTDEEIDQTKSDLKYVEKQLEQLDEAEKYNALSEEEAVITRIFLCAKQLIIQDTLKDIIRYLNEKKDILDERIRRREDLIMIKEAEIKIKEEIIKRKEEELKIIKDEMEKLRPAN